MSNPAGPPQSDRRRKRKIHHRNLINAVKRFVAGIKLFFARQNLEPPQDESSEGQDPRAPVQAGGYTQRGDPPPYAGRGQPQQQEHQLPPYSDPSPSAPTHHSQQGRHGKSAAFIQAPDIDRPDCLEDFAYFPASGRRVAHRHNPPQSLFNPINNSNPHR